MDTFTQRIADFCCDTAEHDLPENVKEKAKACIADALHALLIALPSETGGLLRHYMEASAGEGDSTMVGRRAGSAESAALYHASLAAVHEIDDVHYDTSLHPGAVIVPTAIAAAEAVDARPELLLNAVAVGYEVAVRLSIAAGERHYHYFHSAATCGTVGAAATAGVLLNLTQQQMQNALGIAVTSASGLWEGITDQAVMVKHLHLGMAAERGIRSARLAALGWPGAPQALEGPKGFLAGLAQPGQHAPGENPGAEQLEQILTADLGKRWAIERNIFKRTPFCLGVSEPLEGLRAVLEQKIDNEQIERIRVETSPSVAWMVGNPQPKDECQARFSAPFAMALMLAGRNPETVPLPVQWINQPDVERWLPKIQMIGREDIGRRQAIVTVERKNAPSITANQPLRNMSNQEAFVRFANVARERFGSSGDRLAKIIATLESESSLAEMSAILQGRI